MTTEEIRKAIEKEFVKEAANRRLFGLSASDRFMDFSELFATNGVIATLIYVVAVIISLKSQIFAKWQEEIKSLYESSRYGTWAWWIETAKRWQRGDSTKVINGEVGYSKINEEKRIVKAAMVRQNGRSIMLFVAKEEGGELTMLNGDELTSFQSYCDEVKPLGVNIVARSLPADSVKITGTVVYNGELLQEDLRKEIEAKVNDYIRNLTFGAIVRKTALIDVIMDIEGVIDIWFTLEVGGRVIDREVELVAGYGKVESLSLSYDNDTRVRRLW
jgi:hypothetical protein